MASKPTLEADFSDGQALGGIGEGMIARVPIGYPTLMREVLYWFMPCKQNGVRPRTTVYRRHRYWFCRTRAEWKRGHEFSAQELETCCKHCADIHDPADAMMGPGTTDRSLPMASTGQRSRAFSASACSSSVAGW